MKERLFITKSTFLIKEGKPYIHFIIIRAIILFSIFILRFRIEKCVLVLFLHVSHAALINGTDTSKYFAYTS